MNFDENLELLINFIDFAGFAEFNCAVTVSACTATVSDCTDPVSDCNDPVSDPVSDQ